MIVGQVLKDLWRQACEWEGIDPNEKFVIFDERNPYAKFHNQAMTRVFQARGLRFRAPRRPVT